MSLDALTWIDITIIAVVLFSTIVGLVRGFAKEALSLVGWALAIILSMMYSQQLATYLPSSVSKETLRVSLAFAAIFVGTLIVSAFVSYMISHFVEKTKLTNMNRLLGLVFGGARGLLLVSVGLLLASLTSAPNSDAWKESTLVPKFDTVTNWIKGFLPDAVEKYFPDETKAVENGTKQGKKAAKDASDTTDDAVDSVKDSTD